MNALTALSKQMRNTNLRKIIEGMSRRLESGATFAGAVEFYKDAFSPFFLQSIRVGEMSGRLDETLADLADYLEKQQELVRKVKSALIYPCIQLTVALGVVCLLTALFGSFETLIIAFYILVVAFFLLYFLISWAKTKKKGQRALASFKLSIPFIGGLIRKIAMVRFSRSLSLMLSSALPVNKALEQAASTTGNIVIQEEIEKAKLGLSYGRSLTESLGKSTQIPPLVMEMISVGEQTGKTDETLKRVADWYEDSIDNTLRLLPRIITPVMTIIVGLIVACIVIKFYLGTYLSILGLGGQ